jgi:ParB family transcriptional regulator, chromosome partitioning protein
MGKLDELMKAEGTRAASLGLGAAPGVTPPGMSPADAQRLPARLQGTAKSRNTIEVETDRITPDPDQPRQEFEPGALERLAESLKAKGQLQPIRVRWDDGRGAYIIVLGERRWRAAVQAGLKTMTCVVHEGAFDPGELLALQLVENALREDLKPVEQARAYRRLMDQNGWSGNRLAKEISIDQAAVSRALALLDLPEPIRVQVDAGALPSRTAYEISRLDDPAEQIALAERAAAREITGDEVQATVQARKIGRAGPAAPATRREFKSPEGAKVAVTLPPGASGPEALLAILQWAIRQVRAEMKHAGPGHAA